MTADERYLDRARAEGFGSIAEDYDRYRPPCPDALIEDFLALGAQRVLDIGCGTGQAASALTRRGADVLGVEPDARMAAVASAKGVPVELSNFETWDPRGRHFDLITCGTAWHWIDPVPGVPRTAELLNPGGHLARFWSYYVIEDALADRFEELYREHAPQARVRRRSMRNTDWVDPVASHPAFTMLEPRTYRWPHTFTAENWVATVSTFSDHQALEPDRLTAIQTALRDTITGELGGTVDAHGETYLLLAQRK